jgi:hypothetical protein
MSSIVIYVLLETVVPVYAGKYNTIMNTDSTVFLFLIPGG